MSTREQARFIFDNLSENDLQIFVSLFGRIYPFINDTASEGSESVKAYNELNEIIKGISPLPANFDEKTALDDYFKEKYSL